MQTVSVGDNLPEMLKPFFWEKQETRNCVCKTLCPQPYAYL